MRTIKTFGTAGIVLAVTAALLLASCTKTKTETGNKLVAKFSTTKTTYYTDEDITFTNESSGGSGTMTYAWDFGDETTSTDKNPVKAYTEMGIFVVKLTVSDGSGNAMTQKTIQIELAPEPDKGELELKWIGASYLGDIRSVSPAVDNDGNVLMSSNDNMLHKFSAADGSVTWSFDLWNPADGLDPTGYTLSSPAVDTDGTVYIGTGSGTGSAFNGRFYAVKSNGTKKWMVGNDKTNGFWNKGEVSNPRIQYLNAAIGDNSVFIGNAGTIGSVLAYGKDDGLRKGYVTNAAGTGGPTGGLYSGILLSSGGMLSWYGGVWGLFSCPASSIESGTSTWSWSRYTTTEQKTVQSLCGSMALDAEGTIYGAGHYEPDFGGQSVFAVKSDGSQKWKTSLGSVGDLDQGGVVIDKDGVVYVSVKRSTGAINGGIVALDGSNGNIKWHFKIAEDVSSSAAIDQSGNIHFATEAGNYYIIKSDGSADPVVLKKNIGSLIMASESTYKAGWNEDDAKVWSSPVIADDGTIYVGVTNANTRTKSLLVALSQKDVTGLQSDAPWPMKGQNRRHTNRQPTANAADSPSATTKLNNMGNNNVTGW